MLGILFLTVEFFPKGMLEVLEVGPECLEGRVFGIFFQNMVKKAYASHEFLGMFLSNITLSHSFVDEFNEVVMTTEVEVVSFLYFTVNYLGYIEVVGAFLFVASAIFHSYQF